jgi:cytochrome c-type biogenesis protein CcmF
VLSGKQLMIRKFISSGSYVTHAGFALLVLGALISTSKRAIISRNYTSTDLKQLGKNYDNQTASLLIQNDTVPMGPYYVTYKKKTRKGMNVYFAVEFLEKKRDNTYQSLFTLYPRVQDNPVMGKASDPDTRHFAGFDVYTYVSYADLSSEEEQKSRGFGDAKNYIAHLKDSIVLENTILVPDTLFYSKFTRAKDTIIRVYMGMIAYNSVGKTHTITPYFEIKNQSIFSDFVTDSIAGIMINFWKINPENATFEFIIKEDLSRKKDFIVLEAHVFPAINLLWSGCILMVFGTIMVVVQKVRQS